MGYGEYVPRTYVEPKQHPSHNLSLSFPKNIPFSMIGKDARTRSPLS